MSTRSRILAAAANLFEDKGYDPTSVAQICHAASVSNGSFFHAFRSKAALGAALYLNALGAYHDALMRVLEDRPDARQGVARLIEAHMSWVLGNRPSAIFMFEQSRSDWLVHIREQQTAENTRFGVSVSQWLDPLMEEGGILAMPHELFFAQLIGPAQLICRAWLSGRTQEAPSRWTRDLVASAQRALIV